MPTPTPKAINTPTQTMTPTPNTNKPYETNIVKANPLTYNLIVSQNKLLSDSIQINKNKNTTNNQKSNYQSNDITFLNGVNNILFIIYYFLVLIVCYYLFYDKMMNWKIKIGFLFVFAIYPYVFNVIKYYLVKFILYVYSFVNFRAYEYN